jgi:CRISPR-associated endonuclease/helicase Cas3
MALADGKCVCWMRNTVADTLAAHARFKDRLPADKLTLFHARFALEDRLRTERKVLALFGNRSTPMRRSGRLVIATQVAEQSLDADWDFVVSDLAPIDRLIQRAGRLQRHPRDERGRRLPDPAARDRRGAPCLWVFGPAWVDDPPARWFKAAFPRASGVYPHHGQLWLTAKALRGGRIAMPDDARQLIESVFGEDAAIPEGLQSNANAAEGRGYADASVAQQNTVKLATGYVRGGIDWWSEAKTPSRLGEASMNVLLARWEGDHLRP